MLPPFTSRVRTLLFQLMRAFTLALGARVALLSARYLFGGPDVRRYQLESATVAFVVVGALLLIFSRTEAVEERQAHDSLSGEWTGWCLVSLVLYWPSLRIGLLSDDFILVDRVQHHAFGLVQSDLFRPLPLLAW